MDGVKASNSMCNSDLSSANFKFCHSVVHGCHLIACGCDDGLMTASGAAHFKREISMRRLHSLTKSKQFLKRGTKNTIEQLPFMRS